MSWNPVVLEPENGGTGGSGVIKLPPTAGPNQVVDGGMEAWNGTLTADNWFTLGGTVTQTTGVTGFGLDLASSGFGMAGFEQQSPFGLNPGDLYVVTAQVNDVSVGIHGFFAFTSHVGSDDVIYNFSTLAWDVFVGSPSSDQQSAWSLTPSTFTLQTSAEVSTPSSGYFSVVLATGEAGELAFDDVTLEIASRGSNILTNGDFELWTNALDTPNALTHWTTIVAGGPSGSETLTAETSLVNEGTYAAKISNDFMTGVTKMLEQTTPVTGLTPGDSYPLSFYARCGVGDESTHVTVLVLNAPSGSATKVFNWDTAAWDAFTGFEGLGSGQVWTDLPGESYVQYTPGSVIVPASGSINIIVGGGIADSGTHATYIDSVDLSIPTPSPIVACHDLVNNSDISYLTAADSMYKIHTTGGGIDFIAEDLRANGDEYTTFSRKQAKDFVRGQDLKGVEDTDYARLLETLESDHLIGSAMGVDLTATGLTALTGIYGISGLKKLINAYIVIETVTSDTVTVPPVFGVGTVTGSYNEIITAGTLDTGMSTIEATCSLPASTAVKQMITGAEVKLDITTGATAVAFTANVYLFGTLLNV